MKEFYIDCDSIRLHAKLDMPASNTSDISDSSKKCPLCILIHGFTGHMEEDHLIAVRDAMNDSGLAVLRVEMYGHGKSDGEFRDHTLYKWVTNALAVVKYAKSLDFVTDLYLCGHSQGGLLTMLVGGMCPEDLKAIIPMSPAWMIPDGAREGKLLGIDFDPEKIPDHLSGWGMALGGDYVRVAQTIHVEDEIARFKKHVLLIHGDADETVPYFFAQKAHELYADSELVTIQGADHCFRGKTEELADSIREYFKD